jgi:signal transduction histidine kinase
VNTSDSASFTRHWWQRIDPARLRLWAVLVPVHLGAFLVLYLGTLRLLENAYADAGAEAARQRLELAVREMPFFAPTVGSGRNPHVFDHLIFTHAPIGLRLFGRDGNVLGTRAVSADPDDVRRVREFLADPQAQEQVWVEAVAGRDIVRGLHRIRADAGCMPCHATGTELGVATMRIDYTEPLAEVRRGLRLRVGALVGAWVLAIGAVTMTVQRSARRAAARLEAEFAEVSAGGPRPSATAGMLVLDPVAAEVHRGLRRFLERQRQREAEVATRLAHVDQLASLGQLAASLAHEIKNPLAGLHGALEVLRDEDPDGARAPLYAEMLGELKRVNGILQQLLESGRPAPLRPVPTDLGRLLADTAELMTPALRRHAVELAVQTEEGLAPVRLDPAKIRQVLVNLIQNAAEAMRTRNGGRVTVRASRFPDGGGVILAVADDGPGILDADRERIFQPFFTTKFTGTGLGLAITRSLVEQHGGRIDLDSEPGRGTTFFVVLPDREAASSAPQET